MGEYLPLDINWKKKNCLEVGGCCINIAVCTLKCSFYCVETYIVTVCVGSTHLAYYVITCLPHVFACSLVKGTCCWNTHGGYMQPKSRMGPSLDCSPFWLCCHCITWRHKYHNTTDFKVLGNATIKLSQSGASAILHHWNLPGFLLWF